MIDRADVVVIGAGIAGVSTAFWLTRLGVERVVLSDPRPPLTLTSDKSTECYRNWWPGPGDDMVRFMNRSIDILDDLAAESGNAFNLNRRGYLFVTADPARLAAMAETGREISGLGAGELRTHTVGDDSYVASPPDGIDGTGDGADLFLDGEVLRRHFPYLSPDAIGGLHARRAGWFSAQQLGTWMLDRAREAGLRLVQAPVTAIATGSGGVESVTLGDGSTIETGSVVNCAGPMVTDIAAMVGEELPVFSELHLKVAFRDNLGAVPRQAPMVIWNDPQWLDWSMEERAELADLGRGDLLDEMPVSCHGRPEGGPGSPWVLALWEYHRTVMEPTWPLPDDPLYPEVVLRGLSTMVPSLGDYLDHLPHSVVDGGYYTKTAENRLLAGPMRTQGMFLVGALSGYGVMAACAAGELGALHVTGGPLPAYAPAFLLDRYRDPGYVELMKRQVSSGQI